MLRIFHLSLGAMRAIPNDPNPNTICHCLLLEENGRYALIDTGMGVAEMERPEERFGQALLEGWGFEVNPGNTAVAQLGQMNIAPESVHHVVMTHLDVDHAGGLADFPAATIHLSGEELANVEAKNPRYVFNQFEHGPQWRAYGKDSDVGEWFGLPSRRLDLGFESDVRLIPLFGHTNGHCGVAIQLAENRWLLHAGDTFYRRREILEAPNPLEEMVSHSCDDNEARLRSLAVVKRLVQEHGDEVAVFSTHDSLEFSRASGKRVLFVTTSHNQFLGSHPHPTGVWLEEFAVPYEAMRQGGATLTVASPKGGEVPIDPRSVPTPEQEEAWAVALEAVRSSVPLAEVQAFDYDAVFLPGGHGPMFDLPNNPDLMKLLHDFDAQQKVVGAVCHGPAGFVGAKRSDGTAFVAGRRLTCYTQAEEVVAKLDQEVPFSLEGRLRELGAVFVPGEVHADHVERDGILVTGQNPQSSASVAHVFLEALLAPRTP